MMDIGWSHDTQKLPLNGCILRQRLQIEKDTFQILKPVKNWFYNQLEQNQGLLAHGVGAV